MDEEILQMIQRVKKREFDAERLSERKNWFFFLELKNASLFESYTRKMPSNDGEKKVSKKNYHTMAKTALRNAVSCIVAK